MNELLRYYQAAVASPTASGFEHLQMLDIRDDLEAMKSGMSAEELQLLIEADNYLFSHALTFYTELTKITDLTHERLRHTTPPSHWWWYLDVLVQLPAKPTNGTYSRQLEFAKVVL